MEDFPAAHSMDTVFFAVDRDGRVALFNTGENGALPHYAFSGDEAGEQLEELTRRLPRCGLLHVRGGRTYPGHEDYGHLPQYGNDPVDHCLMFLDSLRPVQKELDAGRAVEVPATEGFAVFMNKVPAALFRRLHRSRACRGCCWWYVAEGFGDRETEAGLYVYEHLPGPVANPYGQTTRPARPVHIDQLPPGLREQVQELRLNLSFEETLIIQPAQHAHSYAYHGAYLDSSGKVIRLIPGDEGLFDFDEEYIEGLRSRYQIEGLDEEDSASE